MTQAKQDPAAYAPTPAFEAGRQVRSEVMGEQYVQRALDAAQQQGDVGLQQLVTEFAWGTVWTRDGLDRKQRSLVPIPIAAALARRRSRGSRCPGRRRSIRRGSWQCL
ncbi:4-carboxymuconolactone decarboxylase [Cupriavidus basilensis OR16]|uniref:4-carboxymuconolactone decarboxylase n=1 Tax=Cupriavidus basilensis OR16 TaxID=1127483 RepID=H1S3M5_9BURK|nr:carboxymuconolactone decarboxylase family protein [Cupriavidus basilensis]EHP42799.1 4-carboxymuconolactone decarboxylase [Cupriavidus basilensis OR16]